MDESKAIDEKLIELLKAGDRSAFRTVFNLYEKRLYAFVFSITKSHYSTEELLQEIFIKLWQKKADLKTSLSFNAFIYTIARNLTYNHLRKIASQENLKQELWKNISFLNDVENKLIFSEYEAILEDILAGLPQKKRSIFILSRQEGRSNQEIADLLGISKKTVKNHLWDTLKQIKAQLQPHLGLLFPAFFFFLD
ncbi:RNA polymerase sigma-70 factor [Antarcticibacterium sp. 1MA-6-2]|uniref:RNA polymerase sigma factor n=1 Tax=Antarcticibacterium sp. 1MA-6-2 TaxID=2908210 RepID=UPI001F203B6A|nr:RNA polymerase sigma-70 factor [Antarcticibacterium sp. 1MA-6-2]UJH92696.1 RNA polymerase sigma-70 factor [Antarcticibacterium sp. 1MA-6-2]